MNTLTFSIITPSYNQGQFIEETIKSVLDQEGEFYIDYIIMDGGSTDNSVEIIKKYEQVLKEKRWPIKCRGISYRWVSEKDRGQSHAINKGFGMARGEIGAWLNSDDYYNQGALAAVVDFFQDDNSLAMVYGDGYFVDSGSHEKKPYNVEPLFDLWKLIHLYDFISQPSVFMKLEALRSAGFLDGQLHYIMDWELWVRLSRFGKILHVPEKLSCARVYFEAKTQAGGIKRWKEIRECSRKHGHMRWPPVVLTQFFHGPAQTVFKKKLDQRIDFVSSLITLLKRAHYALIGGNKSGIYIDGCVERVAFISIPLRKEVSKLCIRIAPLCDNNVGYLVNNAHAGAVVIKTDPATIEILLTDAMKRLDFMHIKFVSEKAADVGRTSAIPVPRKCAFIIRDIYLHAEDNRYVRAVGLPQFTGHV